MLNFHRLEKAEGRTQVFQFQKLSPSHCQMHTQGMMVSSYSGAKTLLECFFRVDRRENTCKDMVVVGEGLSVAA